MAQQWEQQGCKQCWGEVLSPMRPPLIALGVSVENHARLWRCNNCPAFWIENEREIHSVTVSQAREVFPALFDRIRLLASAETAL